MQVAVYDNDACTTHNCYEYGRDYCYGCTNEPINGDGFSQCQQDDYVK